MPECPKCEDEVDELCAFKIGKKKVKVCEACLELLQEEAEIAEMSEDAIKDMMGYKGSW